MTDNILCPVCSSKSVLIENLPYELLKTKIENHFNIKIDIDLEILDYNLLACTECTFQFAYPFVEGSPSFYNWITIQSTYYPSSRWEYSKVIDITKKAGSNKKLIDVGCGDGRFLDFIKHENVLVDYFGLDTTQSSINKCAEKGHKVYCMDIKAFKNKYSDESFDIVTSFHVLEHIANPKQFISDLVSLLSKDGFILLSTPYSPMDFELDWFDVLNHPPHHMGRWNYNSYKKIAEVLNLNLEIFMPKVGSIFKSAIVSFIFSNFGNSTRLTKIEIIISVLRKPLSFLKHFLNQSSREKVLGNRASNSILVKLSPKD